MVLASLSIRSKRLSGTSLRPREEACTRSSILVCYANGIGIAVDKRAAIKWYTRAANAGNAAGQYNLGAAYYHGMGVDVNRDEGIKWITRLAEAGHAKDIA